MASLSLQITSGWANKGTALTILDDNYQDLFCFRWPAWYSLKSSKRRIIERASVKWAFTDICRLRYVLKHVNTLQKHYPCLSHSIQPCSQEELKWVYIFWHFHAFYRASTLGVPSMMINGIQCISEEEPEMCNLLWIRKNQLKVTIETIIKSVVSVFYFCNVSALFSKK